MFLSHEEICISLEQKRKKSIPEYRIFEVKYYGPTNTQGSRVKITDGTNTTVTIPYSYDLNSTKEMAEEYLKRRGIKIMGASSLENKDFLLSKDFDTRLK